jgi:hypothetical protein
LVSRGENVIGVFMSASRVKEKSSAVQEKQGLILTEECSYKVW